MLEKENDIRVLGRVVIEILEEAAFLFTEPMDEDATQAPSPELIVARIGYRGPSRGEMLFSTPTNVAVELAANLLGLEPDDPEVEGKGDEAVGEMLNIIGGALLKEWFGSSADFEMGIPKVERMTGEEFAKSTKGAALHLPLITDEGERIDAAVMK